MIGLPILMYHGIHTVRDERHGVFDPRYSVTAAQFARQLDWLGAHGYAAVRLGDEPRSPHGVVLSFDDGDRSAAEVAMPMLAERGMAGEFCITTDWVGQPGRVDPSGVRALAEGGMGIASHGRTHRFLADMSAEELAGELTSSKLALEGWLGRPVDVLSLPGGRGGRREFRAARAAGYRYVLDSVPGPNRSARPDRYLHRMTVTRRTTVDEFGRLVRWRGMAPRRAAARAAVLEVPKRVLGNTGYTRVRELVRPR